MEMLIILSVHLYVQCRIWDAILMITVEKIGSNKFGIKNLSV